MATFADIKTNVKLNLGNSDFYSDTDVNDSVQDAYNEVVMLSQCIVKKVTLSFQDNLNYYNLLDLTNYSAIVVPDFLACTAIFSNKTNLWLLDDKVIKDFDRDRIDWENWIGDSVWWVPTGDQRIISLIPKQLVATGTFDLYYWATAPTVVDTDTPLIPEGNRNLVELYSTADLLESAEEFQKAKGYWDEFWGVSDGEQNYDKGIYGLASRSKNLAKSDLLMLA